MEALLCQMERTKRVMRNIIAIVLLGLIVIGCDSKDESFSTEQIQGLNGTWLLTEQGWSPGSGYIVDPVAPSPVQTVSFTGHKTFSSNIQGLSEFKFFAVMEGDNDITNLLLYVDDPESENGKPASKKFYIELNDGLLKVMPIGCIEGCHFGFRKDGLPRE
jgi:hypothetical protein